MAMTFREFLLLEADPKVPVSKDKNKMFMNDLEQSDSLQHKDQFDKRMKTKEKTS